MQHASIGNELVLNFAPQKDVVSARSPHACHASTHPLYPALQSANQELH
jgi:hypothetical protein